MILRVRLARYLPAAWLTFAGGVLLSSPVTAQVRRCRAVEVVVSPPDVQVTLGGTTPLAATAYDAAGSPCDIATFSWTSSDVHVASVDSNGLVNGRGPGVAVIRAHTGTGAAAKSATAVVTVAGGSGTIVLMGTLPQGASVSIGGRRLAGSRFKVPAGPTQVLIESPGYRPFSQTVMVAPNTTVPVQFGLVADAPGDVSETAGFWIPAYSGSSDGERLLYAKRMVMRLDSAVIALVETYRNTSGNPVAGASDPARLTNREKLRWLRCRNLGNDLRTFADAAAILKDSIAANATLQRAAAELSFALVSFSALDNCDVINAMVDAPDRFSPWQLNYENEARAFYRDWYPQARAAQTAGREFARALNAALPADQRFAVPPALPPTPPYIGAPAGPASSPGTTLPPSDGPKTAPAVTRDTDEDGIPDVRDRCRNTAMGVRVDVAGCPANAGMTPATDSLPAGATGPQEIERIRIGETVGGVLESSDWSMGDGTPADIWYLILDARASVTIDLRSTAFDAYLQLLDPAGRKIAEDDDGGGGRNARVEFTATTAGRYQIVANYSGFARSGAYKLSVR